MANKLGLEFVPYAKVTTDLPALDAERDRPSVVAERRGCGVKRREGIVLRPPIEVRKNNSERIIAKYKDEAFAERKSTPKIVDAGRLAVLADASAIAEEWVTEMRLTHVIDRRTADGKRSAIEDTRDLINAMVEDVTREASGEIVDSKEVRAAIGKATAIMFKRRLQAVLKERD